MCQPTSPDAHSKEVAFIREAEWVHATHQREDNPHSFVAAYLSIGESLDSQMERIKSALWRLPGSFSVGCFVDAASANDDVDGRPAFKRLVRLAMNGRVRVVVVARLARLVQTRDALLNLLQGFHRRKVFLWSLAEADTLRRTDGVDIAAQAILRLPRCRLRLIGERDFTEITMMAIGGEPHVELGTNENWPANTERPKIVYGHFDGGGRESSGVPGADSDGSRSQVRLRNPKSNSGM